MTVTGISGTTPNQPIDQQPWAARFQQGMAPVAQLFGESPDQLMSELNSGQTSLSALAQQKGISQTDLVNAIKSGLQQSAPNGGANMSDSQLTNIANRIANHKHHGHHHHHGGGAGAADAAGSTSAGTGSQPTGDPFSVSDPSTNLNQLT
jgi:hypothetical protein